MCMCICMCSCACVCFYVMSIIKSIALWIFAVYLKTRHSIKLACGVSYIIDYLSYAHVDHIIYLVLCECYCEIQMYVCNIFNTSSIDHLYVRSTLIIYTCSRLVLRAVQSVSRCAYSTYYAASAHFAHCGSAALGLCLSCAVCRECLCRSDSHHLCSFVCLR